MRPRAHGKRSLRKLTVIAIAVVLASTLLPVGVAGANHSPHTRCDPSGDSCISVKKINGVRRLRLGMLFRYFPKHMVCVKGPSGERTCHSYRTRKIRGLWGSSIDWRKNYPFDGRGIYRVAWRNEFGPHGSLKFHVRGGTS